MARVGKSTTKRLIVTQYARMWPREIFDIPGEWRRQIDELQEPGVYILYRDDVPYYVGRAAKLSTRLHDHANKSTDRYFNFWNFFSVFVVPQKSHLAEVEGILIASMPTANRAVPRIPAIELPKGLARILRNERKIRPEKPKARHAEPRP